MQRAATDVMQSIFFSAFLDAVDAVKKASGGMPNVMVRDLLALHPNTAFADLPKPLQDSIAQSVRSAFTQLLKEGYAVGPKADVQASRPLDRVPERDRRGPGSDRRTVRSSPGRRGPGGEGGSHRGGSDPGGAGRGGPGGGGRGGPGGGGPRGGPRGGRPGGGGTPRA